MLRFAVFDDTGPAREWRPRHARLVGPDDVCLPGSVRFENGLICCERPGSDASALRLLFPVGASAASPQGRGPGLLTLQTCLLPQREAPYLLSLELARHRIMFLLNKLEDWGLVDLPGEHPALQLIERARQAFTEALVTHRDRSGAGAASWGFTPEGDARAREALSLGIEASELLARTHAGLMYAKRASNQLAHAAMLIADKQSDLTPEETREVRAVMNGCAGVILPTPPQLGVAINPQRFSPELQQLVASSCDFICMPMRWRDMEPEEGRYSFTPTDRWIEWSIRQARLPIMGGPVIDFRVSSVPEWLYIWEHDYETLRELVHEHVKHVVTRYRKTVSVWTVASGLCANTNFTFSHEQMMDLSRMCAVLVRRLHPSAKIQVEIDIPWGEFTSTNARSLPPLVYADLLTQAGINIDLLALRVHMGSPGAGRSTYDLALLSALLDRYAQFDKPLALSVGAPSAAAPPPPPAPDSPPDPETEPGYWREPWSPAAQARWLGAVLQVAAGKPYVHSVCWSELYDQAPGSEMPTSGLAGADGRAKEAIRQMMAVRQAVRDKRLMIPALEPEAVQA